ncbi:MAG: hypothetical protein HQL36_03195 [Alphaproteobacteria bacterium]|nr:hypothetical protein [Alphaproteobacteria bacterium]MBF0250033.1 hypothetical protein [Alphaproteobacteria bacterium]
MSTYMGLRLGEVTRVTVDGDELNPRLDLRCLSEDGFEWGYVGSGPYQLALAILAHELGEQRALGNYRSFCENTVARLRLDHWVLEGDQIEMSLQGVVEVNMTLEELLDKVRGVS